MTPLYGHDSEASAYHVADYPYSFKLRTEIRFWIEHKPKRGFRFMSQTRNPKVASRSWNKPKASTYSLVAACMYLDDEGHVQWSQLNEYSDAKECAEFIHRFPDSDLRFVRVWAAKNWKMSLAFAGGIAFFTVNGERKPMTEADRERYLSDAALWAAVVERLASRAEL